MGPERVKQTIKKRSRRARTAIHIVDDNFAQLDPLGSAKAWRSDSKGKSRFGFDRVAERRPRLRANRRVVAGLLDLPTRRSSWPSRSPYGEMRLKRELEAGWFQHIECRCRRAVDSIGHQQSAVRDSEGHHGGQEERDRRDDAGVARVSAEATQKIERFACRRKRRRRSS